MGRTTAHLLCGGSEQSPEAVIRRMADNAWAAGMLDAAGEFVAYPRKDTFGGYIVRVRLRTRAMEGRNTMDHLEAVLGGHDVQAGRYAAGLPFDLRPALEAHVAVRPYLRRQSRRAQLLHELCDYMNLPRGSFEDRGLTEVEVNTRELLVRALRHARRPKL